MARRFTEAGIPAAAVSATARRRTSGTAPCARCARGEVNVVFAVDLFNEGVDVPEIDTVLFLRPTESATVFLQQLGRGLRHARDKAVPDRARLRRPAAPQVPLRPALPRPHPATRRGDRASRSRPASRSCPPAARSTSTATCKGSSLDNLRHALPTTAPQRVAELRPLGDVDLATYLHETGLELEDVYRAADGGWATLRAEAGLGRRRRRPGRSRLGAGHRAACSTSTTASGSTSTAVLSAPAPPADRGTRARASERLLTMLHFGLWGVTGADGHLRRRLRPAVGRDPPSGRAASSCSTCWPSGRPTSRAPARAAAARAAVGLHARYARDETLAAFGIGTAEKPADVPGGRRSGTRPADRPLLRDAPKSEQDYSPTTLYRDYAISPDLFHWESQSTTSDTSPTGQRYINHAGRGSHVCLFAREAAEDAAGGTVAFLFLGRATYLDHRGERPMAVTWRARPAVCPQTSSRRPAPWREGRSTPHPAGRCSQGSTSMRTTRSSKSALPSSRKSSHQTCQASGPSGATRPAGLSEARTAPPSGAGGQSRSEGNPWTTPRTTAVPAE